MTNGDIQLITAKADDIVMNPNEVALRLHTDRQFDNPLLTKCRERLYQAIHFRCAYVRVPVDLTQENVCDFGFMTIPSKALYRNLKDCGEVFLIALTTGLAVDRLLSRLNILSQAEHFMTDALASAAIESFCDTVCDRLQNEAACVPRFSIGYGDVSITFQKPFLERLNAYEHLGITLNAAYLMTPVKSITAFMGIRSLNVGGLCPPNLPPGALPLDPTSL